MREKVIVIIPTYNEALVIAKTLNQVLQATQDLPNVLVEILVFDSASQDDTQSIVKTLMQDESRIYLQVEPQKTGLGSAYHQAMRYALSALKADIVMEFDADLSHQPQYIGPMIELLKNCDVVVGSRYIAGGSVPRNWGIHRKMLSRVGNAVAQCVLTTQYNDLTSGFRATRANALQAILPVEFLSKNYGYKLHLTWLLHRSGVKINEFPINFIDRTDGCSKLPANSIVDSLRVIFTLRWQAIKAYFKRI